jgi:hypothetical protein
LVQRSRRSFLAAAGLGAVCVTLVLSHGAVEADHMTAGDGDPGMSEVAISICLAIVQAGAFLLAVAGGVARLRRRPPIRLVRDTAFRSAGQPTPVLAPPARAGPAALQVFLR